MTLDEALSHTEDKLRAVFREERARLVMEIEAMRRQHAAKGRLHSGATLKRIRDLGIESLHRRIKEIFDAIKNAVDHAEPRVIDAADLMPVVLKFIPENLDDQGQHIRKAVTDMDVPKALPQLLDAVAGARANALQKAEAELQLYLRGKAYANEPAMHKRLFGSLELISILVTLVLAVLWIRNPEGAYEGYLVLFTSVATLANLFQKWQRKAD
jgi:hypothetical protein